MAAGGYRIHYRASVGPVAENRPAVVMVHGMVISGRYLTPTAELLAPDFPVYAPDLPGFGESEKPPHTLDIPGLADALAAWIEAVGLGRVALLGNSMGCQVIADLASRRPELVERAVLQGPTVDPMNRTFLRQGVRWFANGLRESSSQLPIMARDYRRAGARRVFHTLRHTMEDRIEEKLPRVQAPTLVVRGSRDPIVPQRWAEEATALLPRGTLVVIPGAPHTMNFTNPLELARVVRPFLEGQCAEEKSKDHGGISG